MPLALQPVQRPHPPLWVATRTLDSGDAESHTLQELTGPDFTVTEDHIPVDETDRDAELVMLDSCNDLAVAVALQGPLYLASTHNSRMAFLNKVRYM